MKKNDGGQVYPSLKTAEGYEVTEEGISRRDWLAGLMGQALKNEYRLEYTEEDIAEHAYKIADAMIEQGEKE